MPLEVPLAFVLPADSERPSGGHLYNRALLDALAQAVEFERLSVFAFRAKIERGTPGFYFLDTLDLGEAKWLDRRGPGQYFGLIVHHLPSLEPDLPASDPALAIEAQALPRFDVVLCTSPFSAAHLAALGVPERKLVTVLPAPPVVPPRTARSYSPPLRALVVANLVPRKAVLPLLELLAEREAPEDFELTVVGRSDIDPAYAAACKAVVERSAYLGERVRLEPDVCHERMADYYQSVDLLLSPARMETFGMAIQEARAFGLPVLVRDGGYAGQHVAEAGSGLVVSGAEELIDAFLSLAREPPKMRNLAASAERVRPAAGYGWPEAARSFLAQLGRP